MNGTNCYFYNVNYNFYIIYVPVGQLDGDRYRFNYQPAIFVTMFQG